MRMSRAEWEVWLVFCTAFWISILITVIVEVLIARWIKKDSVKAGYTNAESWLWFASALCFFPITTIVYLLIGRKNNK
jgi:hypothetical protein